MTTNSLRACLVLLSLIWLSILTLMPPGLYTSDETAQLAALAALESGLGLVIDNGTATFDSASLIFRPFVVGPGGLVPQYPSGFTFLAYPFFAIAGVFGIFVLNTLAAVGILWISYLLAKHFDGAIMAALGLIILMGCTFLVDYAATIWPHAPGTFVTLLGIYCGVRSVSAEGKGALLWAGAGGVAFSVGLNIRYDVLIAMPPLSVWIIWFAPRPFRLLSVALVAMLPGVLLSAYINHLKFGTWVPMSYGDHAGGGTNLATYSKLSIAIFSGLIAITLARSFEAGRRTMLTLGLVLLAVGILLLPPIRGFAIQTIKGLYVLGYDLTYHRAVGVSPYIVRQDYGYVTFFNLHKKALVQSMPWLFLLPLVMLRPANCRAGIILALLMIGGIMVPYAMQQWHGGKSNNLRYLLVVLPFAAYLGAHALNQLKNWRPVTFKVVALTVVTTLVLLEIAFRTAPLAAAYLLQHHIPNWLFVAGFLCLLPALIRRKPMLLSGVWFVLLLSFSLSFFSAYRIDVGQSAKARSDSLEAAAIHAAAGPGSVIYTRSSVATAQFYEHSDIVVARAKDVENIDWQLIEEVLESEYALFVADADIAREMSRKRPDLRLTLVREDEIGRKIFLVEP